ncbi:endonuclease/exonuclease/phosphatase family protein [Flavobacterium aurantiibacter]|uniref:Endonuclease n=1 Tax=Flavobacterium aurantiibacter TaxID=2023067 RepID=A0A255ZAY4_9FLAO|nr:endonuclease/exonuclease/phosphatase family protein [Flavobacterium aurantiibacter]OYQ38592.1 endonuclease [Flavobacterium aurantiibacter]
MAKLSWFNKVVFFFNWLLAAATIIAYLLPRIAPSLYPVLAALTLFLPALLIGNGLFLIFWVIQLKRQAALSLIVLLIGITFVNKFYGFRSNTNHEKQANEVKIVSYNVRLFNKFRWSDKRAVPLEISDFVKEQNPDILCIQEFSANADFHTEQFPYKHTTLRHKKIKTGQAIFSKYKIINSGVVSFPNSDAEAIFADVLIKADTVRVYNMHLESVRITPSVNKINNDINELDQSKSEFMLRRIGRAFRKQQNQAEKLRLHRADIRFRTIVCGDMNNSAFSYVYRQIKGDLNDTFVEAGSGLGKTYDFKYYPARIDYILADKRFEVKDFDTFNEIQDSDHFPIATVLAFTN